MASAPKRVLAVLPMWLRVLLFAIPTTALVGWVHLYLYRRLVKPIERRWLRLGIVSVSLVAILLSLSLRLLGPLLDPRVTVVPMLWGGFLLYAFMMLLLAQGASRFNPERRALFQRGALVAASGLTGYGAYRAYTAPEVTETVVPLKNLPAALEGYRIVQLTDIHVGSLIQTQFLRDLVDRANALKPDLTVITGDLVDGKVRHLGSFVQELGNLSAKHGRYFVTGNHDYYSGADEWAAFVQRLGFNVMRNRSELTTEGLRLVGVDDWSAARFGDGGYDLDAALTNAHAKDEPTILFAHQPANFDEAVTKGIGLQISGHTHGGQMFPATVGAYAIWQGRNRGLTREKDSYLYVSKGCGFVGPPMRVGSPPEIASIILVRG